MSESRVHPDTMRLLMYEELHDTSIITIYRGPVGVASKSIAVHDRCKWKSDSGARWRVRPFMD
jgi:hypothetical protein